MLYLQKKKGMDYSTVISPKMQAVEKILFDAFVGMGHCLTDTGKNIIVEVPKSYCEAVRSALKKQFTDVVLIKKAYSMIEDLHDFILVKPLISESPLFDQQGIPVPELEKILVDRDSDKEYAFLTDADIQKEFQRAFEIYPINTSRLLRYAGRKGKKEEIQNRMQRINQDRVDMIHAIQDFLTTEPVERAWLFGSFSRMEERPDSDVDLLVDFDPSAPIGLIQYAGIINNLENKLGRKVDMVENGTLKSFAQANINYDKVLIYERA